MRRGLATWSGLLLLWACVLTACSAQDTDPELLELDAKRVCEEAVKDRLKAPSTAEFSGASASQVGDEWTVKGDVDSENGFGAMIRDTYTCKVEDAGDKWRVISVDKQSS